MRNLIAYFIISLSGLTMCYTSIEGYLIRSGVKFEILIFCIGFSFFIIGAYSFAETIFFKIKNIKK